MRRAALVIFTILTVSGVGAAFADPTLVTQCRQTITDGVLTTDLDCASANGFALRINYGGSLDLGGHTLIGTADYGQVSSPDLSGAVACSDGCTIRNGTIAAPEGLPVGAWRSHGIYDEGFGKGTVTVDNVTFVGWTGTGVTGRRVVISNSTLSGNKTGVSSSHRLTIDSSNFHGNVRGLQASRKARLVNVSITNSGESGAYFTGRGELSNSLVSGSGDIGVFGRVRALGSVIENSCLNSSQPSFCADIVAMPGGRPRLDATSTCGTSLVWDDTPRSFLVCTMD